ncbi:GDSL esterase/lipase [Hibiscus syriacus]|uniref:GDSL esterase/lipase n=1 Tax=Hibiscus syriacus TaxID=106335 RepID=A0A6A3CCL7_HIBSY|nr:GDSL esterase/lipase At4g26790-like [Hibiscus syriacus]KAE8725471.1 GDSL esterase/lipase [Hibiscus syriacus]
MAIKAVLLLVFAYLLVEMPTTSAMVPAVIVFGDSTVDPGNNNQISTVLKSNFAPYGRDYFGGQPTGRFSNGRIATDFISEAFGIKPAIPAYLDPKYDIRDFATGVSFASAGTGYDNATSDILSVIPFWKEMEYYREYQSKLRGYLGNDKASHLLSESLHLLSIGTNDFLENYYILPTRSSQYSVDKYKDFLIGIASNFIRELYKLGARKVAITGLAPIGCLPLERTTNIIHGSACIEEYNNVAKDFNVKLQGTITEMNQELGGIQIVTLNTYDKVLEMIHNPTRFGFENAEKACCGTGYFEMSYLCDRRNPLTCSDANKYIFWDAFHPSEKTNFIIADYLVKTALVVFR